jgi:predicted GNAT family N-acyltransferase
LLALGMARAQQGFDGPLTVVATRNACEFYRRHGFVPVAEETMLRGSAQVPVEVVRMQRPAQAPAGPGGA